MGVDKYLEPTDFLETHADAPFPQNKSALLNANIFSSCPENNTTYP